MSRRHPVSRAIGMRRLLVLARFLRRLPRRRFDYGTWTGDDWKGSQTLRCGTTACALGWAATMPIFRRAGLHINNWGDPQLGHGNPFRHATGTSAAEKLFHLHDFEADHLFLPGEGELKATPKQVAQKIEAFVKRGGGIPD